VLEDLHVGLLDQPQPWLDVGQAQSLPELDDAGAQRGELAEGLVAHVHELLAGGQEAQVGATGGADLFLLLGGQSLVNSPPGKVNPHGRRHAAQAVGRAVRLQGNIWDANRGHGNPTSREWFLVRDWAHQRAR
jgi:hypothetical protein